jgi:hypothetical protein
MKFTYSSGQRPLEGYTIKRGIGRGGFGEVYFALSDGGKEVALKLVRDTGNRDVELRGVGLCLNLKHPHLVNLFDLRKDARGDQWVIMEYVSGDALNNVIQRHPQGLPLELVREWFLGLARAISYLHDHGIVHRDLKPANIFIENGVVKVGDYGLSKSISTSRVDAQTQTVGTVYYMAPEIKSGKYDKHVDIYASGVLLYQMLTGLVPFDGVTAAEVLLKHLTDPPDLSKVPNEYVPILQKALAKNPDHRYASMAEFARAVEAVGQKKAEPASLSMTGPVPVPAAPRRQPPAATPVPAPEVIPVREQVRELCGSLLLTVLFGAIGVPLWATLFQVRDVNAVVSVYFMTIACCWAILIPAKLWTASSAAGDGWVRRVVMLALGAGVGAAGLWVDGYWPHLRSAPWALDPAGSNNLAYFVPSSVLTEAGYLSFYALAFFALRWWELTDRQRSQRFNVAPALGAGFWGLFLLLVLRAQSWRAVVVLVLASIIVQLASPWKQPPPPVPRRYRLRHV